MPNGIILLNINSDALVFKNKVTKDIFSSENIMISSYKEDQQTQLIEDTILKEVRNDGVKNAEHKKFKDVLHDLI